MTGEPLLAPVPFVTCHSILNLCLSAHIPCLFSLPMQAARTVSPGRQGLICCFAMISGLRQAALWYKAWWLVAFEDPMLWFLPGQTSSSVGLCVCWGQVGAGLPWVALWVRLVGSSLSSRLMVFGENGSHGIVGKSFALEGPESPHGRGPYSARCRLSQGRESSTVASLRDRHWPQWEQKVLSFV